MWTKRQMPWTFNQQASSEGAVRVARGPTLYAVERCETVPEWVSIRYIPPEKWDSAESVVAIQRRGKQSISNDHLQEMIERLTPLGKIAADAKNHGRKPIKDMIDEALVNVEEDHNMVALILRDDENLRSELIRYCHGKPVAPGTNSYWVSAKSGGGRPAKSLLLGIWFTQKMPNGTSALITTGYFEPGQPIMELRISDLSLWSTVVTSEGSEVAAKKLLQERFQLSEDDFTFEPNGPTTFPDWDMRVSNNNFNVEVTRVRQERDPVYVDQQGWQDTVERAARQKGRLRHDGNMSRKAKYARNDAAKPTILVVFNEEGEVNYQEEDLEAFFAVIEVDEYTGYATCIHPRRA